MLRILMRARCHPARRSSRKWSPQIVMFSCMRVNIFLMISEENVPLGGSDPTWNLDVNSLHVFIIGCSAGIYPEASHCGFFCRSRLNLLLQGGQADCSRGQTRG